MPWIDLLSNQMVSFTDAQGGGFTLKAGQSNENSLRCVTKAEALAKYNLVTANMDAYANTQLVPKSVWVAACLNCVQAPVTIGTQTWDKCNLNVTTYRNGDVIPQVTNQATWANLTTGAWCHYNNDPANDAIYGKLYNWYAVNDPRGLAPVGKSIPTDAEWTTLTTFLGGESVAGEKMKETGLCYWNSPNNATNSSGFSAFGGGFRNVNGSFNVLNIGGYWWSSSLFDASNAWWRNLSNNSVSIARTFASRVTGMSVRCLITPPVAGTLRIVHIGSFAERTWSNITNGALIWSPPIPSVGPEAAGLNGPANTQAIITQSGHISSAASACDNLVSGGFSDWYLPAWGENNGLFTNRTTINSGITANGGTIIPSTGFLWSSSPSSDTTVTVKNLTTGANPSTFLKSDTAGFRAMRRQSVADLNAYTIGQFVFGGVIAERITNTGTSI